jgi:hypothetical protein
MGVLNKMDRDEVIETINKINIEIMNIPNVHHCEFCDKPTEKGASHYVDMFYKKLIDEFNIDKRFKENRSEKYPDKYKQLKNKQ